MPQSRLGKFARHAIAAVAALATSGCFYSDVPLVASADFVQPIRAGLWESLVPVGDAAWTRMPDTEKATNFCRTIGRDHFCAERLRITLLADRTYRLQWQGEADIETVQFAVLSADSYIVQQVSDDRSAEYALAMNTSPDAFAMSLPRCDRDSYLHAYAPPLTQGSSRCRVPDRASLEKLFTEYLGKLPAQEARIYRRIGD